MHPAVNLGFDLADLQGYAYYTGIRFAAYAEGCSDAVLRGGRYDEVGAVFGRRRPAARHGGPPADRRPRPVRRTDRDDPAADCRRHRLGRGARRVVSHGVDGRGRVQIADAYWEVTGPELPTGTHVRIVGGDAMTLQVEPA